LGEGLAFLMGWNLILEFVLSKIFFIFMYKIVFKTYFTGTSSVARGYSGYVDQLMGNPMRTYFKEHLAINKAFLADFPDLFALALVLTLTGDRLHNLKKIHSVIFVL